MSAHPPLNRWPWLNPVCRGCKWADVKAEKDKEGQIWHEAQCTEPEIVTWLSVVGLGNGHNSTVILDRPCKKYQKKRNYNAAAKRSTGFGRQ